MKTAATNKKIRELIQAVREDKLVPRPEFQRRLVWSRDDKNHFLDTILRGYPFPEIYLADGDVNLETGAGTQLLVDGLQRVSTIIQYFDGHSELQLTTVLPYRELSESAKRDFLQYDVAVRDLGAISREEVIEVFKRLNATKYSLLDIEVNNAVYAGALKKYAERVAEKPFFSNHGIFSASDLKRMGDLRYALTVIITMMRTYFNRDDAFGEFLEMFNDDFPHEADIEARISIALDFIEECGFSAKSRVWRKADLFSLIIEVDNAIYRVGHVLQPSEIVARVEAFFGRIEAGGDLVGIPATYYKAALQASNDRVNRVRRGVILFGVLVGKEDAEISDDLERSAV